jgi:protocatechuate 3,4-dioxygenase beta subunit
MSRIAPYHTLFPTVLALSALLLPPFVVGEGEAVLRFSLEEYTVTINGQVTDAQTKEPIAHAHVQGHVTVWRHNGPELFDRSPYGETTADANGKYELVFRTPLTFSGPLKGKDSACISVAAEGYETKPRYMKGRVTPYCTDFTNIDVQLSRGHVLRGRVVDSDDRPVAGALVRVQNGSNGDWNHFGSLGKTFSDERGTFELWIGQVGSECLGSFPWLVAVKPDTGSTITWDIHERNDLGTLKLSGGKVEGRVIDAEGRPVKSCDVSARKWPVGSIASSSTDMKGRYVLTGIPTEKALSEFYKRKNRKVMSPWLKADIYARLDPARNLRDAAKYQVIVNEGETAFGPDLVVLSDTSVSGTLVPSGALDLPEGLMVRVDSGWGHMIEADGDGTFLFPNVSAGKHKLTAYLPTNLRGDRGIGSTQIEVDPDTPIGGLQIDLDPLALVYAQFIDIHGAPLEGITIGATWSRNGTGLWTEGTRSDVHGWASLYLCPGKTQYVRGFDHSGGDLVAETFAEVALEPDEVVEDLQIVMLPPARVRGVLLDDKGEPLADTRIACRLSYADGTERSLRIETDTTGHFESSKTLRAGVVTFAIETVPLAFKGSLADASELKASQDRDLGTITLDKVQFHSISGQLVRSPTFDTLEGFRIRLDLQGWKLLCDTDAEGRFTIENVPVGSHRLTAYLPHNLRTDRGVGHANVEVRGEDLGDVALQLETLATVKVRIVDESGRPLEGVAASAWWNAKHTGVFTEGTKSDAQGRATLYMCPGENQYIGAHDWNGRYRLTDHTELAPEAGQVVDGLRIVMLRETD